MRIRHEHPAPRLATRTQPEYPESSPRRPHPMLPRQLALVDDALDAVATECVRSPVATMNAGHLRAVVAERWLRDGCTVVERGSTASERRLVRLVEDVVQIERGPAPADARRNGRPPRPADLRLVAPVVLGLDLWARGATSPADRLLGRQLHDRLDAVAAGTSDVLLVACDRRAWDALRVERTTADGSPAALSRLCAALLPPSPTLGAERSTATPTLGGRRWTVVAAMTPMVFGAQRVVAALWTSKRSAELPAERAQLDAFDE